MPYYITPLFKKTSKWEKVSSLDTVKYGDEACLIFSKFSQVDIFVGLDLVMIAKEIQNLKSYDLIILDDAFQHRSLHRNMDIVLLDASAPLWHYYPLPVGKARELVFSLSRANWIVKTKTKEIASVNSKVLHFHYDLIYYYSLQQPEKMQEIKLFIDKEIILLTSLSRPEVFVEQMKELNFKIKNHFNYESSYQFTEKDLNLILEESKSTPIFCTEKDAVKLKALSNIPENIYSVFLTTDLTGPVDQFFSEVFSLRLKSFLEPLLK